MENVRVEDRRVLFSGDENALAKANICLRTAERIHIVLAQFEAKSFEELFQGVKNLPWEQWIGKEDAFPVKGYSLKSQLFSVSDCQAIIKKAVVDRLKSKYGISWFTETGPVHQIQFSIMNDVATLLIDTTGAGLHKRGYRLQSNFAPMKETLAAAICSLAKLKHYHTLYDPMCGSGTLPIEAALIARNIAPGVFRKEFAFEKGTDFDQEMFDEIYNDDSAEREFEHHIYGYDIDWKAVNIATNNVRAAGLSKDITIERRDMADFVEMEGPALMVTNPPYGERITTRGISQQLKNYADKYGLDKKVVYPHSFRHRYAKNFLEKYNDIALLADLMGHESIETTRIYLRRTASEQQALVDKIVTW